MKKLLTLMFVLLVGVGMVYSQSITVTSPNGGENWDLGSTHNVTWTSSGVSGNVGIKLFHNGSSLGYVAQNIPVGSGSYSWTISTVIGVGAISAGSNYQIQVKQSGVAGDLSDGNFVIGSGSTPAASITVNSPNGGESWEIGGTYNVTWSSSGVTGNVGIKLFQNGSSLGYVAQNIPVGSGIYSWTISNIIGGGAIAAGSNYKIQVKQSGVAGDLSNGNFTISNSTGVPAIGIFTHVYAMQDLELKNVYFTDALGGRVVARIKSNVNPFKGNIVVGFKKLPRGREQTVTKSVDLNRGEEKVISLFPKTRSEMGCNGISLRVKVDPGEVISESNEDNNILYKTVYANSEHDGIVEHVQMKIGGRFVDVGESVDIPTNGNYRTEIRVTVKNCGGTRLEEGSVNIHHNLQTSLTARRGHCRSYNEIIGSKTGISLSPGISRTYSIPVTLRFQSDSYCRKNVNEITVKFDCGENSVRNRNNSFKFSIR